MLKGELFSTDMVRAYLEGRKKHTARPVKPKPEEQDFKWVESRDDVDPQNLKAYKAKIDRNIKESILRNYYPKFQPGDFMYCRETWQEAFETEYDKDAVGHCVNIRTIIPNFDDIPKTCMGLSTRESCKGMQPRNRYYVYKSSNIKYANPDHVLCWRPSIHMPRSAARLFFRVTKVEVMRLEDVTEEFAREDGFESKIVTDKLGRIVTANAEQAFLRFWKSTYGPSAHWMWVYWTEPVSKEEALADV